MPEPLWTPDELEAVTDAQARGAIPPCTGVTFDSRTVTPGDLFVALRSARDGHDFVASAFERGAACALVSRPVEAAGPQLIVDDTFVALGALAAYARDRSNARRAAVTGSVGKTSVTQAIHAAFARAGPAHASVRSFNNHIGVPLTLARMPRETERAVFELGMNHAGEIEPLSRLVQPDAAVITVIGPVHIENFADGEAGVARAKAEVFKGLKPGGAAVLNADDAWFGMLSREAEAAGARVVSFGSAPRADARLLDFAVHEGRGRVRATLHGRELSFGLPQTARHGATNGLAVLLVLEAMEVAPEVGIAVLSEFAPLEGRGAERVVSVDGGEVRVIDESYNANPLSMRAALITLGTRAVSPPGRRIAALTDMLELGPDAARLHAELLAPIQAAEVDLVFCAGRLMKSLWDEVPASRRGAYARSAAELAPLLVEAVRAGDVVMVKGSNGSRASALAQALTGGGAPAAGAA